MLHIYIYDISNLRVNKWQASCALWGRRITPPLCVAVCMRDTVSEEMVPKYSDLFQQDKYALSWYRINSTNRVDRDSVVGIATRYGLYGPEVESWWRVRFSAPVQNGPVAHPASYTMGAGSFPGVKRPGLGVDHPPTSSAEVKERLELHLYSPSGPSWPVLGCTLLLSVCL